MKKPLVRFFDNLGEKEAVAVVFNIPPGALLSISEEDNTFQIMMPIDIYEKKFKFKSGFLDFPALIKPKDFFPFKKMVDGNVNDFISTEAMIVKPPLDDSKWSLYIEKE